MDPGDADEPSREELESRVEQLEQTVSKMLPDRRGVLKGLGAAALGGAAVAGSSGGASGQSSAGQVGTASNPVDVEGAQGKFDLVKTEAVDITEQSVVYAMGTNGNWLEQYLISDFDDIGAAVNQALTDGGGRTAVYLPPGSHTYSTTIDLLATGGNQTLKGQGHGTTYLDWQGSGDAISVGNGDQQYQDCTIRDFRIHGSNSSGQVAIHYGRGRNLHCFNIYQKDCEIGFLWDAAFQGNGDGGAAGDDTIDLWTEGVVLEGNNLGVDDGSGRGLKIDASNGKVNRGRWGPPYIFGNGIGVAVIDGPGRNILFEQLEISNNWHEGVLLTGGSNSPLFDDVLLNANSVNNNNSFAAIKTEQSGGSEPVVNLNDVDITGSFHSHAVDISDGTTPTNGIYWVGGKLSTSHGKINFDRDAQQNNAGIWGVNGWKNAHTQLENLSDGDTINTGGIDGGIRGTFVQSQDVTIVAAPDSVVTSNDPTLRLRNVSDASTPSGSIWVVHTTFGRTVPFA